MKRLLLNLLFFSFTSSLLPMTTSSHSESEMARLRAIVLAQGARIATLEKGQPQQTEAAAQEEPTKNEIQSTAAGLVHEVIPMSEKEAHSRILATPDEVFKRVRQAKYALLKIDPRKRSIRFLFYGKPGVGKSSLAQAIASHLGIPAWLINCPGLVTKMVNAGGEHSVKIFQGFAALQKPIVLIFDEINQLTNIHEHDPEESRKMQAAATFWGEFDKQFPNPNMIFIATANDLDKMPEQLRSRFLGSDFEITSNMSDESRERMIKGKLGEHNGLSESELKSFVHKSHQFNNRELDLAIDESFGLAQNRLLDGLTTDEAIKETSLHIKITAQDLDCAFRRIAHSKKALCIDKPFYKRWWNTIGKISKSNQFIYIVLPFTGYGVQALFQMWSHHQSNKGLDLQAKGLDMQKTGLQLSFTQFAHDLWWRLLSYNLWGTAAVIVKQTFEENKEIKNMGSALPEMIGAIEAKVMPTFPQETQTKLDEICKNEDKK